MPSRSAVVLCLVAGLHADGRAAAQGAGERDLQSQIEIASRQVMELEMEVEREKRFYPPAEMWEDDIASVMKQARAAGIADLRQTPARGAPIVLEGGWPSPLELRRLTLTGHAEYDEVRRFLDLLAQAPRRTDLEDVRLVAASKGGVAFTIQLGLPLYIGASAAPPRAVIRTPEDVVMAREALLRARLAELVARASALQALQRVFALHLERTGRARVFAALSRFHRACDKLSVALTGLRFDQGITIEGLASGAAARAGLGPALKEAGLSVRDVPFVREGSCHRFSVTAALPVRGIEDAGAPGNAPYDAAAVAACAAPPGRARGRIAARGSDPKGITVRLRGVDVPDLFRILGTAIPLGFIVDGDVDGRVDVDYDRASIDDAFAAMGTAGIVGQVGALIRVSNASAGVQVEGRDDHTGAPVSVDLKNVDLRDLFELFEGISGFRYELAKGFEGRVSLFAIRVAWDRVVEAIADSAGLRQRVEGKRVVLEEKGPRRPVTSAPLHRLFPLEPAKVGVEDLQPLGAALVDGVWRAYAYSPGRVLRTLTPGARFFNGEVKSVTSTAVTFAVAGRTVEMNLP